MTNLKFGPRDIENLIEKFDENNLNLSIRDICSSNLKEIFKLNRNDIKEFVVNTLLKEISLDHLQEEESIH